MIAVLLVFGGGAVGSAARFLTDRAVQARHRLRFPLGTLTVNVVGCLVLGLVAGLSSRLHWSPHVMQLVGTGFCGGLTTYSTFAVETVELVKREAYGRAAVNVVVSLALGLGVAAGAYLLTSGR